MNEPIKLNLTIGDYAVEVACYQIGEEWLCRVSERNQPHEWNDAYYPPVDFGFFWIRNTLASGMVNEQVFTNAESIKYVLYEVMERVVRSDDQLSLQIALVDARFTYISSGEEDLFLPNPNKL